MRIKITKEQKIVDDVAGEVNYTVSCKNKDPLLRNQYIFDLSLQDMKDLRDELVKLN